MTIQVIIDERVKQRSADCRKDFIPTDNAISLVLKQVFPGLHIYGDYIGFCNHNGYEVSMRLPPLATDWKGLFDQYTPEQRRNLPNIRFTIEVPELAVRSMGGDWSFGRRLQRTPNVTRI